jgi:DNA polymerase III subunit delta'
VTRCVWDDVVGQERVASFLQTVSNEDRVSHAYLFVGVPGSGKATAARALACALLCDDGGCGACAECYRIRRGAHPDVHLISPKGAAGYVVEQVRDLSHDVSLAPIEGRRKIYIVSDADLFNEQSGNAFLKTLEEPPEDAVIILMAHSYDAVLPTIASRCQVVRFRRVPASDAVALLVSSTGADPAEAKAALAAAGGVVARARDFLASSARREARAIIVRTLSELTDADELDVLNAAKELLSAVKAPLDELKETHSAEATEAAEYLGKPASKELEERHKRELTAREREGIAEVLNVAESWLRDCLVLSLGADELLVNADEIEAIERVAAIITPSAATAALGAVNEARRRISYNVSPQLAVEVMLFDIREVLRCPR